MSSGEEVVEGRASEQKRPINDDFTNPAAILSVSFSKTQWPQWGMRGVRKASVLLVVCTGLILSVNAHSSPQVDCIANRFIKTLSPDTAPLLTSAPPESKGITRKQLATRGRYEPELSSVELNAKQTVEVMTFAPKEGKSVKLGGMDYIEFPNSTALRVSTKTGGDREYLLTRGVRPYENRIRIDGSQSPQKYVSDVLLFERAPNGKFVYSKTILKSEPEKGFLFEDPRVSVIYGSTGKPHFFLSGTDYSSHVPGSINPDVMNRFVQLNVDGAGTVQPVKVNESTGKPDFSDMSPAPQLSRDGNYSFIDAKNGTITKNEKGEIVVRLRLRPNFEDPEIKKIAGDNKWHYGEQVYVFKDWKDFRRYDWKYALNDLFGTEQKENSSNRVHPRIAKEIIRDEDLKETIDDPRVASEKGKGLGPGSIPVRIKRVGNKLYVSNGVGAPDEYAGTIPENLRAAFILKPGEVKFLAPDHEIRYFREDGFLKRHYTASFKLFNDELTHIDAYYADAIQPTTLRERGVTSGIVDLQHVYPMGRTIIPGISGKKAVVRIYAGTSDANTSQYDLDVLQVLTEMSEGSDRRLSGQVYLPGR